MNLFNFYPKSLFRGQSLGFRTHTQNDRTRFDSHKTITSKFLNLSESNRDLNITNDQRRVNATPCKSNPNNSRIIESNPIMRRMPNFHKCNFFPMGTHFTWKTGSLRFGRRMAGARTNTGTWANTPTATQRQTDGCVWGVFRFESNNSGISECGYCEKVVF